MRILRPRRFFAFLMTIAVLVGGTFGALVGIRQHRHHHVTSPRTVQRRVARYSSPWAQSLKIDQEGHEEVKLEMARLRAIKSFKTSLQQVYALRPLIRQECQSRHLWAEPVYAFILKESGGNREAIDYNTIAGANIRNAHIGLGQLSEDFLPEAVRNNPARIAAAAAWQEAHLWRVGHHLTKPTASERKYLAEWMRLDPRFNLRWNLGKTLDYYRENRDYAGTDLLAVMAHKEGTYFPLWWVAAFREDHGGSRFDWKNRRVSKNFERMRQEIAPYVRKHGVDYFQLRRDRGWRGKEFRDHAFSDYPIGVVAWSELFARYRIAARTHWSS